MQSGKQKARRKILFLAASPKGIPPLRLDEEYRRIKDSLRQSNRRDKFEIIVETAVTIAHIRRALLEYQPEIVHFCGHGTGTDGIACEDETGRVKLIPTTALANLFKLVDNHVKCVILNACLSEIQANEVVRHIEYVVGMKYSIGDNAALKFAEGFYDALFTGKAFPYCYQWGINAIQLESIPEDSTPVIKTRLRERITGYYWEQVHQNQYIKAVLDYRFQPYAVATTLFIYADPSNGKLQAVTITTHEIYYYADLSNRTSGIKIGGYTAEWHFSESDDADSVIPTSSNIIRMTGRNKRRPGLDISVAGLSQLGVWSDSIINDYQSFIRNIRETFHTARCEFYLAADGSSLTRRIWFNEKKGNPDHTSVFIRN